MQSRSLLSRRATLGALLAAVLPARAATVKLTGWFACERCTSSRVAKGDLRPSNPECARQCIEQGSEPVFISEQGKELLKVRNHPGVKDDLGFHVEVTGQVDASSKTITVTSVAKLEEAGASCARPQPRKK